MKLTIDTDEKSLTVGSGPLEERLDLYSTRAFELLSHEWLRVAWNQKHTYTFTWLGRPIIQLPHDMIRIQEVIYRLRPDVIVETGIAHGGSLVFYASLCRAMDHGRVIGVDIEIRPHNRQAIESHALAPLIRLIEGSSTASATLELVREAVAPGDKVLVILDSGHSKAHVLAELEAYHSLVGPGSYIVATDGFMRYLDGVPRGSPTWRTDNPGAAAAAFLARHPEFVLRPPRWPFNESQLSADVTHWPDAWLQRRTGG